MGVQEYAMAIGLDEAGAHFLASLPQDVRDTIIAEFDPRGTKDGNVLGRLLGFARAVWAQRLGLDNLQKQEAAALLRGLPEEAQARVMAQFDVSGTKDGNILARLQRFANDVASRYTGGWSSAPPMLGYAPAPPVRPLMQPAVVHYSSPPAVALVSDFVGRLGLDAASASFLQALPEEVRTVVLTSFSPSGTKDGNVWGRLFGFVRSVWAQRLGLDAGTVSFLKSLPEETQRVVMVKFDPSRTKDGNVAARLESFARSVASYPHQGARPPAFGQAGGAAVPPSVHMGATDSSSATPAALRDFTQRWGLNAQATAFLEALPEAVWSVVVGSFNANGTKDGNVWGRLFGFVRSVWAQKLGLDNTAFAYIRSLPEDVQVEVIARYRPVQPPGPEALAQLQALADEVLQLAAVGHVQQPGPPDVGLQAWAAPPGAVPHDGQEDLESFVRRCGLDQEALDFLRGLSEEVRAAVVSDFDPGGTKDGNVFGRLQGFTRSVEGRRKRLLEGPLPGRGGLRPRQDTY